MNVLHRFSNSTSRRRRLNLRSIVALCACSLGLMPALGVAADAPIKLNPPMITGGDTNSPTISPDGRTVIYRADQETDEVIELYSAPIGGGSTPFKLNPPLGAGGDVSFGISVTADSSAVIFRASGQPGGGQQLFSVPTEGGTPVRLNGPLAPGGTVFFFRLSPDGTRVLYDADQDTDGVRELYSAPVGGGSATRLSGPMTAGGNVTSPGMTSPDGSTVVYRADQESDNVFELYSVPIDGGTVTKLNPPLPEGADVGDEDFEISPDGSTVVFVTTQDTSGRQALYSVPIHGGTATRLTPPLVDGGNIDTSIFGFITADGSTVVYVADQDVDDQFEIYSVPIEGGSVTRLNPPLQPGQNVSSLYEISADGSRVVYQTYDPNAPSELFSVATGGGLVTKLNAPLPATDEVAYYVLSHDGSFVVYATVARSVAGKAFVTSPASSKGFDSPPNALFSVPIGGGTAVPLATGFAEGSGIDEFAISLDDTFVVYQADQDTAGTSELYRVPSDGGTAEKLNAPLVIDGEVLNFDISPDNDHVVYRADQDTADVFELYSVSGVGAPASPRIFADSFE